MTMSDDQWYPHNLFLINHVYDIVVFQSIKVFDFDSSYMLSCSINVQLSFL